MSAWFKRWCGSCGGLFEITTDEDKAFASIPLTSTTATTANTATASSTPQTSHDPVALSSFSEETLKSSQIQGPMLQNVLGLTDSSMDMEESSYTKRSPAPLRGTIINDAMMTSPEEVTVSSLRLDHQSDLVVLPPDRPPKPAHLAHFQPGPQTPNFDNYANSADMQQIFALSSNNNSYNNCSNNTHVNINNNNNNNKFIQTPGGPHAPDVSRELKPGRKSSSGSQTIASSHHSQRHEGPPVERTLKPKISVSTMPRSSRSNSRKSSVTRSRKDFLPFATPLPDQLHLSSQDSDSDQSSSLARQNSEEEEEQIYFYMPPVNTVSSHGGKSFPLMIPADSFEHSSVAYIDLDLPKHEEEDIGLMGSSFERSFSIRDKNYDKNFLP